MIRRIFAAAALALLISSASASATTATAFGDSFTETGTTWYDILQLGDDNYAQAGAVCNPKFTTLKSLLHNPESQRQASTYSSF